MNTWLLLVLLILGAASGCKDREDVDELEPRTEEDLMRAIEAISDRREAEYQIISEEERIKEVLEENIEEANSDGMRRKIREEIQMRESAIWKAEKNIANQDSLLRQLHEKYDSLYGGDRKSGSGKN